MKKSRKPPALVPGDTVRIISPASPAKNALVRLGVAELARLGYRIQGAKRKSKPQGYFAAGEALRAKELELALKDDGAKALVSARGGYGTSLLLNRIKLPATLQPKIVVGFSDLTALHAYLWQMFSWTFIYGPMAAAGFDEGAGARSGYDRESFLNAVGGERDKWTLALQGETMVRGAAEGIVLGGCITLIANTLGTPWELDTRGAILVLEDIGIKPYELDRLLVHLLQAGKLRGVRGLLLGDFLKCDPPKGSRVTARDVCMRVLKPLGLPMVFGAPVGHTKRPMLTVPLGVRGRLEARGRGSLQILESAVQRRTGGRKA